MYDKSMTSDQGDTIIELLKDISSKLHVNLTIQSMILANDTGREEKEVIQWAFQEYKKVSDSLSELLNENEGK
jgi:hypothetical protein